MIDLRFMTPRQGPVQYAVIDADPMINRKTLQKFWGADLRPVTIPAEFTEHLSYETRMFLRDYGLPKRERIYREHENQLKSTTPFPQWKYDRETVEARSPFFDFETSAWQIIEFKGETFITIGKEFNNDISIETKTQKIYYLNRTRPEIWPIDIPLIQESYLNRSIELMVMSLTLEFQCGRDLIGPIQKYVGAINDRNKERRLESLREMKLIMDKLEQELAELDHDALYLPGSWWKDYIKVSRTDLGLG